MHKNAAKEEERERCEPDAARQTGETRVLGWLSSGACAAELAAIMCAFRDALLFILCETAYTSISFNYSICGSLCQAKYDEHPLRCSSPLNAVESQSRKVQYGVEQCYCGVVSLNILTPPEQIRGWYSAAASTWRMGSGPFLNAGLAASISDCMA